MDVRDSLRQSICRTLYMMGLSGVISDINVLQHAEELEIHHTETRRTIS
jgi:hypothetical protein